MKKRKKIRISDYDYSTSGIYFITICSNNKDKLFCKIDDKIFDINFYDIEYEKYIEYTEIGHIIIKSLNKITSIYNNVDLLKFVVMPNHIHLLIEINNNSSDNVSISIIIGSFKRYVSKTVKENALSKKGTIWQKSFYEHIVRDEKEYNKIYEYIVENPIKWKVDEYYK